MLYLIDGYNLLHAMGVLHGQVGPTGLEKARLTLLGRLHGALGEAAAQVTVVFDAAHAPHGVAEEQSYHGIQVLFAVQQEQADDLIEDLIRRHSVPRRLTVVSDDHRIQLAARRRHCTVMKCADFLDEVERQRHDRPQPPAPIKPETISEDEAAEWLRTFTDGPDPDE